MPNEHLKPHGHPKSMHLEFSLPSASHGGQPAIIHGLNNQIITMFKRRWQLVFERILIATGGSKNSGKAAKAGIELAKLSGIKVVMAVSSSWRLGFTAGLCRLGLRLSHQGHLMRRPPMWSGLPSPPRCLRPASAQLPACHRSRRPGSASSAMASRCRSNAGRYRRMVASLEACFIGWATRAAMSLALS